MDIGGGDLGLRRGGHGLLRLLTGAVWAGPSGFALVMIFVSGARFWGFTSAAAS
jgi:hypothetical protein